MRHLAGFGDGRRSGYDARYDEADDRAVASMLADTYDYRHVIEIKPYLLPKNASVDKICARLSWPPCSHIYHMIYWLRLMADIVDACYLRQA